MLNYLKFIYPEENLPLNLTYRKIDAYTNLIYIDKSGISNINILDYLYLSDYAHILNKLDNITNLNSYWCEKFRSIISNDFQKLFGDYNQSG